jgi:hypothetical protein
MIFFAFMLVEAMGTQARTTRSPRHPGHLPVTVAAVWRTREIIRSLVETYRSHVLETCAEGSIVLAHNFKASVAPIMGIFIVRMQGQPMYPRVHALLIVVLLAQSAARCRHQPYKNVMRYDVPWPILRVSHFKNGREVSEEFDHSGGAWR